MTTFASVVKNCFFYFSCQDCLFYQCLLLTTFNQLFNCLFYISVTNLHHTLSVQVKVAQSALVLDINLLVGAGTWLLFRIGRSARWGLLPRTARPLTLRHIARKALQAS